MNNPFDQFADTLQSALPPQQNGHNDGGGSVAPSVVSNHQGGPHQFNLMAQPAAEKKPIMMNAGMMAQQQQQQMGMYGGGGGMYGQPQQQQAAPMQNMMAPSNSVNMGGFMGNSIMGAPPPAAMAGALVPSTHQSNPYALGPPAAPPVAAASPFHNGGGAPPPPPQNYSPFGGGQPSPQIQQQQQPNQMVAVDPFSGGGQALAPVDPWGGAQSVAPQQQAPPSNALVPSTAPPSNDPFGLFFGGGGGGQSVISAAPPAPVPQYQQPPVQQQQQQQYQQQPPAPAPVVEEDPWNVFGEAPAAAAPPQQQQQQPPQQLPLDEGDLFDGGIGAAATRANQEAAKAEAAAANHSAPEPPQTSSATSSNRKKGELPPGGEWYDAKIFTPTLGVMFFKPKELVDSLFLQTDKEMVDSLDERPVVAFIVEGSSARSAGVELGHVLLKVNGIDVKNPKEASRLIKEGPRPLPLLFYVPETQIVVAEGEHMVKYNTKETGAPNSAKDWKPKYVVIGGIIAQPWMMNMYRSKSEYDIAVIETQARRPVSVKVKQFSLQGARIQNDWQGPQMVKYKNKLHPWKYIVILPVSRNPIKIASPNLSQLRPCHEGVRRVLMAQQRDRGTGGGGGGGGGGPRRQPDPYRGGGGGGGGRGANDRGYDTRERRNERPDYEGDRRGGGY
mmetsp:Transcript_23624/g.36554  ORF Transcript_23624/g.36554 Transcript_23624/m.36554 type:complete len:670 (-) Transcript_23624:168-2177(-)